MFWKRKPKTPGYDAAVEKPVLRKSICTGETAAGFKNLSTGRFREVMLIKNDRDLKSFLDAYGIETEPETIY